MEAGSLRRRHLGSNLNSPIRAQPAASHWVASFRVRNRDPIPSESSGLGHDANNRREATWQRQPAWTCGGEKVAEGDEKPRGARGSRT